MAPETADAIDVTELAELIEDEDCDSDETEPRAQAAPRADERAMA